jgi:transposase
VYNHDECDLPQINLGLVMSLKRRIPLYYKIFPSSINDVVTLKNLIVEMKEFGVGS